MAGQRSGGHLMAFTKPDKPAKLRGMRGSLVINTRGTEVDATGAFAPTTNATKSAIPCTLEIMSPAEAFKNGKDTDLTMYRIRLAIRHQDGTDIRLDHGQDITVTCNTFTSGAVMVCVGAGHQQGRSGQQLVIARLESR